MKYGRRWYGGMTLALAVAVAMAVCVYAQSPVEPPVEQNDAVANTTQNADTNATTNSGPAGSADGVAPDVAAEYPDAPAGAIVTPDGWFPPRQFNSPPQNPGTIYFIPIHGEMMSSALDSIIRMKATQAVRNGARVIVFDIDTPGGRLDVTERIISIITRDLQDVFTVAFVNPQAISAGSLVAVACDRIYMTPGGRIGDARPISSTGEAVDPGDRAKIESYIRAMVREPADAAGYNVALVEAMISLNIEVWLIRHNTTGQLQMVSAIDWAHRIPNAPPLRRLVEPGWGNPAANRNSNEDNRQVDDDGQWRFVRVIVGGDNILTMTTSEAQALGFTGEAVADRDELARRLGAEEQVFMADDLGQKIAAFLTSMGVQMLLVIGMIFFLYMEFQEPGLGIFGGLALVCLALLLGGRYFVGLADWWEIILILIGLVLIALEIFVIPGFGVAGISGIVLVVLGLLFSAIPTPPGELPLPTSETAIYYLKRSVLTLGVGFIGGLVLTLIAMRHMKHIPLGSKIVLGKVPEFNEPPAPEDSPLRGIQVGDIGTVESTLRPVGKIRVGDTLCDAVTESAFIEAGTRVRVLKRDGNRLVVEKTGEEQ